jgi:hypothetical protein
MGFTKTLCVGAVMAAAIAAMTPVHAATIVTAFAGGPFSLANPTGTLPATKITSGNTYDFTFTMAPPLSGSTTSTQVEAQALIGKPAAPVAELIQYSLFSGTPGSGTFIAQSSIDFAPVIGFNASPGAYYLKLDYVAKVGEVISGSVLTTGVPEPASWATMLVGLGILGSILRRRVRHGIALA